MGHKGSPYKHLEARVSWSPAELVLLSGLLVSIKQGYIAFKYAFKTSQRKFRIEKSTDDGRSYVGSYHLKTTFLHYLEKTAPSKIISPFDLMMSLLHELSNHLTNGKLFHYFLPQCDLLATVGHSERQVALRTIQDIVFDPLGAIFKCPSAPDKLFGAVSPVYLMTAFRSVSIHPSCEQRRMVLVRLLACIDEWRQQRYRRCLQLDRTGDSQLKVINRHGMRILVDMLEKK